MNTAAQQETCKIPQVLSNDSADCPLQGVGKEQGSGVGARGAVPGPRCAGHCCSALWFLLSQLAQGSTAGWDWAVMRGRKEGRGGRSQGLKFSDYQVKNK